jgi:hypothetical protein
MIALYLTIPIMILALAVAVVPLVWAMAHPERWSQGTARPAPARTSTGPRPSDDNGAVPVGPGGHRQAA